jgi:hypothetical protein
MPQCGDDGWPFVINGMCCISQAIPQILAGGTTVICCPDTDSGNCSMIKTISCDLSLSNPHPETGDPPVIQTIFTDGELPQCDDGCCPWGYRCSESSSYGYYCARNDDQSHQPNGDDFTILPTTTAVARSSVTSIETTLHTKTSPSSSQTTNESITSATSHSTGSGALPSSTVTGTSTTSGVIIQPTSTEGAGGPNGTAGSDSPGLLNQTAIIGIGAGGGGFLAIIVCGFTYYFIRRRIRRRREEGYESAASPVTPLDNMNAGQNRNGHNNTGSNSKLGSEGLVSPGGTTIGETQHEGSVISELPVVNAPCELHDTGIPRPPPAGVYELQ